jgi:small subunit ribosomal protein S15
MNPSQIVKIFNCTKINVTVEQKADASASSLIADIEKLLREQTQKQSSASTTSETGDNKVDPNDTDALFKTLFPSASTDANEPLKTTSDIFNEVFGVTKKKQLPELKFWDLYPTQIKRWLVYLKTPKGYYDNSGRWVPTEGQTRMTRVTEIDEDGQEVTKLVPESPPVESVRDSEWSNKDSEEWIRWERKFQEEQSALPQDLRGHFRFNLSADQVAQVHPKLRRLLSMTHATTSEITALRKRLIRTKWARHDGDTGSDEVQIGILTLRIRVLTEHLQKNKQDKYNEYRLARLVKRRRGLLRHLKKSDVPTYYKLLKDLRLRDMVGMI